MFIVEFYKTPSGKDIVREIYFKYSNRQRSKIAKAIFVLKEYGINHVIPNLRKLSGTNFWEYRILGKDNIRIICVSLIGNRIRILHIFIKKAQKTPIKEIKLCIERYKLVLDN